ncbi:unnamed protein product, partial [Arabidopsis halleri]
NRYKLRKKLIVNSNSYSQTQCKDSYMKTGYSATKKILSAT